MNYQGHDELKNDVFELSEAMEVLRQMLKLLESKYFYKNENLTGRLAGQHFSQMNEQFVEIYKQALEMLYAFKD